MLIGISINNLPPLQGNTKQNSLRHMPPPPHSAPLWSHRAPAASPSPIPAPPPPAAVLGCRGEGWLEGWWELIPSCLASLQVGRKAGAAVPLGRSSSRKHRKLFWEPGEEELGWGRNMEPGKPSSPTAGNPTPRHAGPGTTAVGEPPSHPGAIPGSHPALTVRFSPS